MTTLRQVPSWEPNTGLMCARASLVLAAALSLAACTGTFSPPGSSNAAPASYTLGVSVSGVSGSGLVLQNNGLDNLSVPKPGGNFNFSNPLYTGNAYSVTVYQQPSSPAQTCTVSNATGVVAQSNVTLGVTCTNNPPAQLDSIGGTVSGLQGAGLMLQLNAGNPLALNANGAFTFPQGLTPGTPYVVSVLAYPPGETCAVTNAAGTAPDTNVTNLLVTCTPTSGTAYTVSGNLTWTPGSGTLSVTDNNASCSPTQITSTGKPISFSCSNTGGSPYNVIATLVSVSPTLPNGYSYSCTVANGSGPPPNSGDVTGVSITCTAYPVQTGTAAGYWAWIAGSSSTNMPVPDYPNPRSKAASWKDSMGNFWLFGGVSCPQSYLATGSGCVVNKVDYSIYLNDLWEFTPGTGQWLPVSGVNPPAVCTAQDTYPCERSAPATWVDSKGTFWMFGGNASGPAFPTDLWKFTPGASPGTGQWTNVFPVNTSCAAATYPCGRYLAASWVDTSGNLWMFGGSNLVSDMWEFETNTGIWTQISAGVSTCTPSTLLCPRQAATSWTDASGNFWLFGGSAGGNVLYSGLWEYKNNQWSLVNGLPDTMPNFENTGQLVQGQTGNPGARDGAAGWIDSFGNLWLFGGNGANGPLNDLWMYTPSSNQWTYEGQSGVPGTAPASYGTQGLFAASNIPGGRGFATSWVDSSAPPYKLWLFGGAIAGGNFFNDLWEFWPTASGP